jgi:hypothetical protein
MATRMKVQVLQYQGISVANSFAYAGVGIIEWMAAQDVLPAICPDVFFDTDFDWICREVFPIPELSGINTIFEAATVMDTDHISQAKRRLETGSGLLAVYTVKNAAITFATDVRCLIKE